MQIPLLNLKRQYDSQKEEINKAVIDVLESSKYINGPNVKALEEELSKYTDAKHAIGVGNGTDALVIALEALGVGEGDEVITTSWTFFATAEAISYVGAKPVFVDVHKDIYTIDVDLIEEKISDKTKAIIPVHIFGYPCDMDRIMEIANKHNLYVIEDAAQAIGAKYKGKMIGGIGHITTFSFFPTKNLGAIGDGGLITTNDDKIATTIKALKAHGSGQLGKEAYEYITGEKVEDLEDTNSTVYNPAKYYNYLIGHNSRLDEMQAAILRIKLRELDNWNKRRNEIANKYNDAFKDLDLVVPISKDDVYSVYHLYVLQSDNRAEIVKHLSENGISTGIYYPVPMHMQKVFKDLGYKHGDLPNSEYLAERTFAIPASQDLNDEEIDYIIETIKKYK